MRVKSKSFIAKLHKWNREAEAAGSPVSVFPSLCDPFEDRPELAPWRDEMFAAIDACPWVRLLLLTKRPENILRMWTMTPGIPASCMDEDGWQHWERPTQLMLRPNVWLGTSVENQEEADRRIPELLKCRDLAPVLFLSCEPLLGPVNLNRKVCVDDGSVVNFYAPLTGGYTFNGRDQHGGPAIDWVIVGGESGPKARPMHPDWARLIQEDCEIARVPFFFKQHGEWIGMHDYDPFVHGHDNDQYPHLFLFPNGDTKLTDENRRNALPTSMFRVGKKAAGRTLDGREWNQFPILEHAQ